MGQDEDLRSGAPAPSQDSGRQGSASTEAPPAARGSRVPIRRIALSAALLVVAAGLGLAAWRVREAPAPVQSSGQADIGGPFQLVDQAGRPVTQDVLRGRWSAVFFGYTYCPDTCPATLQALAAAQADLTPAQRQDFRVVFISVDPPRDTPAQMKLYLSSGDFPKGAIGLTGTPAEVAQVAREYHVVYARQGSGPDYSVQHSAAIYLMDPQGQFAKPLDESQPPAGLAHQIAEAMGA